MNKVIIPASLKLSLLALTAFGLIACGESGSALNSNSDPTDQAGTELFTTSELLNLNQLNQNGAPAFDQGAVQAPPAIACGSPENVADFAFQLNIITNIFGFGFGYDSDSRDQLPIGLFINKEVTARHLSRPFYSHRAGSSS